MIEIKFCTYNGIMKKVERLEIRLSKEQMRELKAVARKMDTNMSQAVRKLISDYFTKVIHGMGRKRL